MTAILARHVVDTLLKLGFKKIRSNDKFSLYYHKKGASVTIPNFEGYISEGLLMAVERQVTGFEIADSIAFKKKISDTKKSDRAHLNDNEMKNKKVFVWKEDFSN